MIRHIVMWRVRGETPEEKAAAQQLIKLGFEGLRGKIPGMTYIDVGLNVGSVDYACDVVLITEFESQQTLDAYANHLEHQRVRQSLGDIRVARFQVDYPDALNFAGMPCNQEQKNESA